MGLLMNLFVLVIAGMVAYLLGGVLLGLIPSRRLQQRLGNWYLGEALLLLGRSLLIKRKHGGYVLKGSRYDGGLGREATRLGGQDLHFADETGAMSRLLGVPFGVAHEAADQIVTPFDADLGASRRAADRAGHWTQEIRGGTYWQGIFPWEPTNPKIVDMDAVLDVFQGSANPTNVDRSEALIELAHSMYDRKSLVDGAVFLMAFGAGVLAMVVISRLATSSTVGGGGSPIPIMVGLALVPAGPSLRDILDWLANVEHQRELRDLAQLSIGAVAGMKLVDFWIGESVCTAQLYLDPAAPCLVLSGWIEQAMLAVGMVGVVAISGLVFGRLHEQEALPIGAAESEVSD